MKNEDVISAINKMRNISIEIVGENYKEIKSIPIIISKLENIVSPVVYSDYKEFFSKFSDFCNKDMDEKAINENREVLDSSIQLFAECLDDIVKKYKNNKCECSCCNKKVFYLPINSYYAENAKKYNATKSIAETLSKNEYSCPLCGSSDRDRMIIQYLKNIGIDESKEETKVLHIAPSIAIDNWIRINCPHISYETTDLFMDGVTFKSDVQDMNMISDGYYDVIICSHVLEHVEDDNKALSEFKRILKKDGQLIFLVPIDLSSDVIDEEFGLCEEENWRRFGQGDHCRKYGKQGLLQRLRQNEFFINELGMEYFGYDCFKALGLTDTSTLYVLTKSENVKLDKRYEYIVSRELVDNGPLVSVIMSCYNHGKYVAETIESVINQTYKNIEFIVADDASTDNSVEVMKRYSKYYTKEMYFDNNKGGRISELIEEVHGKYVALINSDDVWDIHKLSIQVEFLENHPSTGATFSWATYVDENLNLIKTNDFIVKNRDRYQWMTHFWSQGNALCYPSVLIRTDKYIKIIKTGRGCRQLFDFFLWVNLVQDADIYVVPRTLVKMRRYSNEYSTNISSITKENITRNIVEEMIQWFDIIANMDLQFFQRAFNTFFRKKDASTKEQLIAEKFFVMLDNPKKWIQNDAIMYFARICKDEKTMNCLCEEYNMSFKKFFELNVEKGFAEDIKKML